MSLVEKIEQSVCDTVRTYVEAQKNNYDRTIQATIVGYKNDTDRAIGKLKLKYQDTYIYAYVTDLNTLDSYTKGENVYVNIPNNDMSSEKTVIGLVKKIGDIALTTLEDIYYKQGAALATTGELEFTIPEQGAQEIEISSDFSSINNNFANRGTQSILLQADFYVQINYNPNLPQSYRIELDYTYDYEWQKNLTGSLQLTIDDVEGNPYRIGTAEDFSQQAVYLTLPSKGENYGTNITVKSFKLIGENLSKTDFVKVKNVIIQPIVLYESQTSTGLVLRISADKLKFDEDAADRDTITLKGILKKGGVLQNLTNIDCYWFEYDGQTTLEDEGYDSHGGVYWYCLNDKINGEFQPAKSSYIIQKQDFIIPQKEYKLVIDYEGQRVIHTIVIKNNSKDYMAEIRQSGDQYTGKLTKVNTSELTYTTQWHFTTTSGGSFPVSEIGTAHTVSFSNKTFMGIGELVCDFFIKSNGRTYWVDQASLTIEGAKALNSVFIENGEQVFLYENISGDNSPIRSDARYPTAIKQLIATGYIGTISENNQQVQNPKYYWLIPQTDTLILPYDKSSVTSVAAAAIETNVKNAIRKVISFPDGNTDWLVKKGGNTLSFTIATRYAPHTHDNIYVVVYDESAGFYEINRTNFSFVQEGMEGTANSGVYCRIVPNALDGQYTPPYVTFAYNNGLGNTIDSQQDSFVFPNYDVPSVQNQESYAGTPLNYFKVQVWKQGEKKFDGWSANGVVSNLSWGALKTIDRNLQIATCNNAVNGLFTFSADSSHLIESADSTKHSDQWIYLDIWYDSIRYTCWLPFLLAKSPKISSAFFPLVNDGASSLINTVYYNEDGQGIVNFDNDDGLSFNINRVSFNSGYSILNYCTARDINNSLRYIFTKYYHSNAFDNISFSSGVNGYFVSIPVRLAAMVASSMTLDSWNEETKKVNIQESTGDIFAKRYIGGEKVSNELTGIIAGVHESSNSKIKGYMTYNEGQRTSLINAEDGSAIFGEIIDRQIKITPTADGGIIKAGTFDVNNSDAAQRKTGMMINFTEPSISFTNPEDFSVKSSGALTAREWHIESGSIYKRANKINRTGIGSNMDTNNTNAGNIEGINLWRNGSNNTAMCFWSRDGSGDYKAVITSNGTFVGKELLISAEDNIIKRVSKVSSTANGKLIGNGLGIGKVAETVDGQLIDVISLLSKKYDSDGKTNVLVLNPYHFHFGDTSSFEIKRDGDIAAKNLTLKNQMILGQWTFDTSSLWFTTGSKREIELNCSGIDGFIRVRSGNSNATDYTQISPINILMAKDGISTASYSGKLNMDGLSFNKNGSNLFLTYSGLNIPDVCSFSKTGNSFYSKLNVAGNLTTSGAINTLEFHKEGNGLRLTQEYGLYLTSNSQVQLSAASNRGRVTCDSNGVNLEGDVYINGHLLNVDFGDTVELQTSGGEIWEVTIQNGLIVAATLRS